MTSFAVIWGVMFVWFSNVINENNKGMYSDQLNQSFVWGMAWFIFSEVMFFFAFFLALAMSECFLAMARWGRRKSDNEYFVASFRSNSGRSWYS